MEDRRKQLRYNQEKSEGKNNSKENHLNDGRLSDQTNSKKEQSQTKGDEKSDYDGGYKHELSNKAHFLHFLKKYVKANWAMELTEDDVKLCDREFLLEDYQKRHADLVYQIHFQGEIFFVYLIMELQSQVDYTMPFRFLTLIFALLSQFFSSKSEKVRERKGFRLPAVIPILFYNGKRPWNAERAFRKYISGHERFGSNILNFEYIVVDLNKIEAEDFQSGNSILDYIMMLDKDKKNETVLDILSVTKDRIKDFSTSDKIGLLKWIQYVLLPAMSEESRERALQIIHEMKGEDQQMIHRIQVLQREEYQRYWDDGVTHGLSQGQERVNRLNEYLMKDHRQDDLLRSVNDPAFQEELMREYDL
jgi:hypothetical protein